MKRMIELNGIANIDLMLQVEADIKENGQVVMNLETLNSIKEELIMLERYMLAYNRAVTNGTQTPFWHEVRANPNLYPRNRESKD